MRDVMAAELWLREPVDPRRLNGCGLLVVNPPFASRAAAGDADGFARPAGHREPGEGSAMTRIADE